MGSWVSLIVGSKFTVFALSYSVFEGTFPSTFSPRGLIFRGTYTWRGLFSEFYGNQRFINILISPLRFVDLQ